MNLHLLLPKLLAAIMSLLQATSLRDRYYTLEQRVIILETAIDDIGRINLAGAADPLIAGIVDRVK